MKPLARLLLCSLVTLAAGCSTFHHAATAPAPETKAEQAKAAATTPLLLISIDAFRADYINRGLTPTLQQMAATGVHADSMQPSFPSLTFPNHYAIVTGLVPDHNGIVNNTMSDPELGKFSLSDNKAVSNGAWWDQGTPLWETADANGLRTASMFWPGSAADIQGKHPDFWKPYDGKVTADQRVDQVLAWLDLPADQRPSFITLYFDAVDHAGHKAGPDSPQVNQALRDTDAAIARLVDGLRQRGLYDKTNIIVLADHGMASVPAGNNILIDKLIKMDDVQEVNLGTVAGFNPKRKHDFNAIEEQLEQPQQHVHCWDKTRIPKRFNYGSNTRVPQLVCLADVGWRITTTAYLAKHKGPMSLGEHGYDNADPLMQALFIAHGPAFQSGIRYHSFPNVDVYSLMAHVLNIPPAFNDGRFEDVQGMLKPAPAAAQ
ncbi:alkaline phosphatase family protein [Dyella mobilis]|uniref:Alkaline phosphatase family protein n=1 Tax=Dyella mobilis TaxID=1849582 RepID=A0ABS2KIR5_9GAMM|nr:ectonucleotide pyrophosphatase/phosphodiesterase [Dyella mobilis]MBM7131062.1 alkaline phosphatase family protein [Dyella mobilis]GLQ97689.1 alkaline phosphatase family protein [Dyella mobilis]